MNDMTRKQVFNELKKSKEGFMRWITCGWCCSMPRSQMDMLVVQVHQSNTVAIHDEFYREDLHEFDLHANRAMDEFYFGQPVKVISVRIDWMLKKSEGNTGDIGGSEFFRDLIDSNNMEFFKIPTVQIIVQYLFEQAVWWIKVLFVVYFADLMLVIIQAIIMTIRLR